MGRDPDEPDVWDIIYVLYDVLNEGSVRLVFYGLKGAETVCYNYCLTYVVLRNVF